MADEHDVRILDWPDKAALLRHLFDPEQPCPVTIHFDKAPANVNVSTAGKPLDVEMDMAVSAREPIPVCIKVCEPICARSSYRIGITLFDQPVGHITVQGETRLFSCDEAPPAKTECVDFQVMKSNITFAQPFQLGSLVIAPLGDPVRTTTIGDPPGQVKLTFPRTGVRIELPQASNDVSLEVSNYASPELSFSVFVGTTLVDQFVRTVDHRVVKVELDTAGVTAVEIRGGDNEASIIEVCYAPVS